VKRTKMYIKKEKICNVNANFPIVLHPIKIFNIKSKIKYGGKTIRIDESNL